MSEDVALREQQVREAVATWTGQLINLDGRNLLLYYKDLKLGTLDVGLGNPVALDELGFLKRGSRIVAAFQRAVATARAPHR